MLYTSPNFSNPSPYSIFQFLALERMALNNFFIWTYTFDLISQRSFHENAKKNWISREILHNECSHLIAIILYKHEQIGWMMHSSRYAHRCSEPKVTKERQHGLDRIEILQTERIKSQWKSQWLYLRSPVKTWIKIEKTLKRVSWKVHPQFEANDVRLFIELIKEIEQKQPSHAVMITSFSTVYMAITWTWFSYSCGPSPLRIQWAEWH